MGLKLTLNGFDEYLLDLKKAGAEIDKAATNALEKSGDMLNQAIAESVRSSGMSDDTIRAMNRSLMKPTIHKDYEGGSVSKIVCEVGFTKGDYNPDNLSGGYIALFNEFGTKERETSSGASRGSLEEKSFIRRAIRKSSAKIKKIQKETLEEALRETLGT